MKTRHAVYFQDACQMEQLADRSVQLMITSPPYPMIEMWDDLFRGQDKRIDAALSKNLGREAFAAMHQRLDGVWKEVYRVLQPGGLACINIGDATRSLKDEFALYPNHVRILDALQRLGFTILPEILWRRPTNSPTKFRGSGMLPAGAYVTLEHEFILIARKGGKRMFSKPDLRANRQASAFFWEERNQWFSDVWMDIVGTRQKLPGGKIRARSAAFPFEIAYRLINMYSAKGDLVLDPFMGTGTTMAAAMTAARHSTGYELSRELAPIIKETAECLPALAHETLQLRLARHQTFIAQRQEAGKPLKYRNRVYGFPVVTNQEKNLYLDEVRTVSVNGSGEFTVTYAPQPESRPATESETKIEVQAHAPATQAAPRQTAPQTPRRKRGRPPKAKPDSAQIPLFGESCPSPGKRPLGIP
ncbi:MAG: site-specific DNA-methyltransferase [Desulfobacterales bacterium]